MAAQKDVWYKRQINIPLISRGSEIPALRTWPSIVGSFSKRQLLVFVILFALCLASLVGIWRTVTDVFMVTVPSRGGSLTEGVIGAPRFVNPLLALSQADRDLTSLVYAGLMKVKSDRTIGLELAERYEVSSDGLTYTFYLRPGLTWHDGEPLSASDVLFTIRKAQDATLKSPKRASWEGVSVEIMDPLTVRFRLSQPFASFLENATIGILPEHIWGSIDPQIFAFSLWNSGAVGSGPYEVASVEKDKLGIPLSYKLVPFQNYALHEPYISSLRLRFYQSDDALVEAYKSREVESVAALSPGIVSELARSGAHLLSAPLPRIFGVFFNQNQAEIFADKTIREALDLSLSRSLIVQTALFGHAAPLSSPLPPGSLGATDMPENAYRIESETEGKRKALELLDRTGWQLDSKTGVRSKKGKLLSFTIVTADTKELKDVAAMVKASWEAIGANVTLRVYELGDLNQNVIRPRKYDALFFGEVIGREPDLFSFWHSSQRNDPGLNIALYTNAKVDKLIDEARRMVENVDREKLFALIGQRIKDDIPASFIYAPKFLYIIPRRVRGVVLGTITTAAERFAGVENWHTETERIWKVFAPSPTL